MRTSKRTHDGGTMVTTCANEPNFAKDARHDRHGQLVASLRRSVTLFRRSTRTNPRQRPVPDWRNEPTTRGRWSRIARTNPIPQGTFVTVVTARSVRGIVGRWLWAPNRRERTHESGQRRTCETNPRHGNLVQDLRERTQFRAECSAQSSRRDPPVASSVGSSCQEIDANEPTSVANAGPTKRSHHTGTVVTNCTNEPNFTVGTRHHECGPSVNASGPESFQTNPRARPLTVRRNEATTPGPWSRIARTNPISPSAIGTIGTTRWTGRSAPAGTRSKKRTRESGQRQSDETNPPLRHPGNEAQNEPSSAVNARRNRHNEIDAWPRSTIVRVTRSTRANPPEQQVPVWRNEPTTTGPLSGIARTNPFSRCRPIGFRSWRMQQVDRTSRPP